MFSCEFWKFLKISINRAFKTYMLYEKMDFEILTVDPSLQVRIKDKIKRKFLSET